MGAYSFGIFDNQQYVAGSSGAGIPGCFAPVYDDKGKVTALKNCTIMFGRQICWFNQQSIPAASGTIYAHVTHPTYGQYSGSGEDQPTSYPTLELKTTGGTSNNEKTVFPLYQLSEGKITFSYLNMPVIPVYN